MFKYDYFVLIAICHTDVTKKSSGFNKCGTIFTINIDTNDKQYFDMYQSMFSIIIYMY